MYSRGKGPLAVGVVVVNCLLASLTPYHQTANAYARVKRPQYRSLARVNVFEHCH